MSSQGKEIATEGPPKQLWELYNEGDFVDAKDNQGDWRVGFIVDKNLITKTFKVRFDGWSSKYDEHYKFTTAKLIDFRTIVIGYTGQKKNPAIRNDWKFTLQDHEVRTNTLKQYLADHPKTARQINQFLRGHNYFYTDFLMTRVADSLESLNAVMEYFKLNIQYGVQYLKNIDPNFTQYYRSLQIPEQSHLINSHSAYVNSYYQVLDTLYTISGSYSRLNSFFANENAALIKKYLNIDFEKNVKRYYQLHMVEQFMKHDGFEVIDDLINNKLKNTKVIIPFLFLKSLTALYLGWSNQLSYEDKKPWLKQLVEITRRNISKLNDKNIKDLNKSHVTELLETIRALHANTDQQEKIDEWALETELNLCEKMILCPYFEKKLKGVVGLIELADRNKMQPNGQSFVKLLIKHKIFESLFAFDNAEIIKKAAEFCKTLYTNDLFPKEMIFKIWQLRKGKHEAALQQIYSLISVFPSRSTDQEFNIELFKEISKCPQEQWDEDYIKMIKDYSILAIGWVSPGEKIEFNYGFNTLYKYATMKKNEFSLTCFIQFLDRIEKTSMMDQFVASAFKMIGNNDESYVNTMILLKIIQEQLCSFKEIDANVSDSVVSDLLKNSNDLDSRIEKRFELLSEVCRIMGTNVTFEEFIELWHCYKGKESANAFFSWVMKKKQGGKTQINSRISTEIRRNIFDKIWDENYDFSSMDEKQSEIFIEFFKSANIVENKIKRVNIIIKTEELDLIGMNRIWIAFESVNNQKIAETLAELIAEIYMTPTKMNEQLKEVWVNELVSIFSKKLSAAYKQKQFSKVKRMLIVPKKIIERDQQIFVTKPSKFYMMKDYTVTQKAAKQQKMIRFNVGGFCYDFKKLVAEKFKIPFRRCKVSCKGEIIKYENYFKTMAECSFHNVPFQLELITSEIPSIKECLNSQLELFFELLGDPQFERTVWEVMSRLPIDKSFMIKVENSEKPWEDINDSSIYKQLYMMRVMACMGEKWWSLFTSGKGLQNLASKFSRITAKTKIEREYLKMLCESIEKCLTMPTQRRQVNVGKLALSIFTAINNLLDSIDDQKTENKKNSVEVCIIGSAFRILERLSNQINPISIMLKQFPFRENMLSKGIVTTNSIHVRKQFTTKLRVLSEKLTEDDAQDYLSLIFSNIFTLVMKYPEAEKIRQFYDYAALLIANIRPQIFKRYLDEVNPNLLDMVRHNLEIQSPQKTIETINYQLLGNLILMKQLIKFANSAFKQRVADFVLYKCFFTHLNNDTADFKCKSKESRGAALDLLKSILEDGRNVDNVVDFLVNLHKNALWRTRRNDDWTLTPGDKLKSASGYVGLKNLGCTCYMNSLFQQIFMIPQFRQAILLCDDPLYSQESEIENVLFQLKKMFFNLLHSEKKFYSPNDFCHAFKNYEGLPTNVHQQMDIDQFSGILFDRLENQMKGTPYENVVKDFFGGVFSNEIICKASHFSETEESFLSVSLSVKNKKNIYQSLDAMIKGDTLDGDNAYFCQRCNKKVSAVKRVCLKKLPDHLILTLKRFEFDFETMNKMKINDYCEFPTELNVKEYSQQYLRKQENPDRFDDEEIRHDDYYDYVLKGVAIHLGYADSGHYYSYIKQRKQDGKWFEFNDTTVRSFDIKRLAEQAFGGEVGTFEIKEKIKNAYMLIYERKNKMIDHSKLLTNKPVLASNPIYSSLLKEINEENQIQKVQNILFSEQYTTFASLLIKEVEKMPEENAVKILKYIITVYLTVTIREKEEAVSFEFLRKLQKVIVKYPEIYEWVLYVFTAQSSITEFFKNNPAKEVKKLLASWLIDIAQLCKQQSQQKFIDGLLVYMTKNNENMAQFCYIIFQLMKNSKICDYVVKRNTAGRLIENILNKDPLLYKSTSELFLLESVDEEIGKQIVIEKTQYELSRKPKPLNETAYVWGILARIIEESKNKQLKLSEYVSKEEAGMMLLPSAKIQKILEESKGKFMIKKVSQILSYFAKDNQKLSEELLFRIYKSLISFESKRYRQFFILMKHLLKIDDDIVQFRTKKGLNFMVKALKENEKYTFDSNIIQQWIMKLIKKNRNLQEVLLFEKECLKYLTELPTKKVPTEDICRKNTVFLESSVNKYHGIKMMKSKKGYLELAKQIEKFYLDLEENQIADGDEWESDDDLTEVEVVNGKSIGYFDQKEVIDFIEVKVEETLLNRLWLSIEKSKIIGIWKDDERLTQNNYCFTIEESSEQIFCSDNTTEMDPEEPLESLDQIDSLDQPTQASKFPNADS